MLETTIQPLELDGFDGDVRADVSHPSGLVIEWAEGLPTLDPTKTMGEALELGRFLVERFAGKIDRAYLVEMA